QPATTLGLDLLLALHGGNLLVRKCTDHPGFGGPGEPSSGTVLRRSPAGAPGPFRCRSLCAPRASPSTSPAPSPSPPTDPPRPSRLDRPSPFTSPPTPSTGQPPAPGSALASPISGEVSPAVRWDSWTSSSARVASPSPSPSTVAGPPGDSSTPPVAAPSPPE